MRRWNGWGEEGVGAALTGDATALLDEHAGHARAPRDAQLQDLCAQLPPSRLPASPLLGTGLAERLLASHGQSLPDWLRLRFGVPGPAVDAVAAPESNAEVRELLEFALEHGAVLIPRGGGTSVVGHLAPPDGVRPAISVSLSRMNRLLRLDARARLAVFQAGVAGPDLEAQLRAHGHTLGHFPQSFEYSTLGGWIATRSSGQESLRYGRIEQLFAGGRVETPIGVLQIPPVPASAAGMDLRAVVLGSEGRVGVLTEAAVRIAPLPRAERIEAAFFADWAVGVEAVRALAQSGLPLSMLRLSNAAETRMSVALARRTHLGALLAHYLSLRGLGAERCLLVLGGATSAARALVRRCGGVMAGASIGARWRNNRFRSAYLRNALWDLGYAVDTVETACNWPVVPAMARAIESAARATLGKLHAGTHLSHVYPQGSSVYCTFVFALAAGYEENLERWRRCKRAASEAIVAAGGTISHHHGVGKDHAPYLPAEKGAVGVDAMRALVRRLDPHGIMASGNLGI